VKSGFVAVAGRPNVGKSTLVNALAGRKVAIVSDKPQTTRRRVRGVARGAGFELVLVDLPGFQRPRDPLTRRMQRTVDESLDDVDAALLVVDGSAGVGAGDGFVARRLFALGLPVVIALNKIDRLRPPEIAVQIEAASRVGDFVALHPVSARTGDGIGALRNELAELLPEGPPHFESEQESDLPREAEIAELVREQALALTREEVPHAVTVEVEELGEKVVRALLYVESASQKQILVGKGGRVIKAIGSRARPQIEQLLGRHVFLDLQVKVKAGWRRDERLLERLGL
jgi:GTP-binding protein Era